MGYEVRRAPANWQHPRDLHGNFFPLRDGSEFSALTKDWDREAEMWENGFRLDSRGQCIALTKEQAAMSYAEWAGERPNPNDYTAEPVDNEPVYLMMYESITEGTPVSPALPSKEALANWLAESNVGLFGKGRAAYENWLDFINDAEAELSEARSSRPQPTP